MEALPNRTEWHLGAREYHETSKQEHRAADDPKQPQITFTQFRLLLEVTLVQG
jgi:hypothetical protein